MDTKFDLTAFRQEFLINGEGWGVSDCYKPYDDKFLRRDAQDAYEGAKWAWQHQQAKVEKLQALFDQHDKWLGERNKEIQDLYNINVKHAAEKAKQQKQVDVLVKKWRDEASSDSCLTAEDWVSNVLETCAYELEKALKGEGK